MSHPNKLVFKVSNIDGEYDIIRRMLCPTCESQLTQERQTAIAGSDGRIKGDRMTLKCTNTTCGSQIEVLFYLPEDYDPLASQGPRSPTEEMRDSPFPLPDNVQNLSGALKSDQINFQTTLNLENIFNFYRDAFSKQGLIEQTLLTNFSNEWCQLVFGEPLSDRVVVMQAIDLAYGTRQDLRNVNIRTERASRSE